MCTFKWHINIGNTYCIGLWIIHILIVDILQMSKFVHMVHMVYMIFIVYEVRFLFLHMLHISMGLVFKMCTHMYTHMLF